MTWIAIADHAEQRFNLAGFSSGVCENPSDAVSDSFLPRGSLVIETRLSPDGRPQRLFEFTRRSPWVSGLSIQALPKGGIVVVHTHGNDVVHAAVDHPVQGRTDVLRVTYSWDAPRRRGRLALEMPDRGQFFATELRAPKPFAIADIREMALQATRRSMDKDVVYFAASTKIEPVGPMPGLSQNTPILGPRGYDRIDNLRKGDLVRSADGDVLPVLATLHRTVPARGWFRPVRLRAPYFGLRQDIILGPHQRLVIGGSQVEYLFGAQQVLVPARSLVNGTAAVFEHAPIIVTYAQVLLPDHQALDIAGTAVESLNIGRLRRKPALHAASLLAGLDRNSLPEHSLQAAPVLSHFDALVLAENRAA